MKPATNTTKTSGTKSSKKSTKKSPDAPPPQTAEAKRAEAEERMGYMHKLVAIAEAELTKAHRARRLVAEEVGAADALPHDPATILEHIGESVEEVRDDVTELYAAVRKLEWMAHGTHTGEAHALMKEATERFGEIIALCVFIDDARRECFDGGEKAVQS